MASTKQNSKLSNLIEELWVFGDSYSDFGSRAASFEKNVAGAEATPAWSGITFSNTRIVWQTLLRKRLGIPFNQTTGSGITNTFVGGGPSPVKAKRGNGSYAIGGALSGTETLYQVEVAVDKLPKSVLKPPYSLANRGLQKQIGRALTGDDVRFKSDDLVAVWSGGNDLLAADMTGADLQTTFENILEDTRENLIALIRRGEARSILVSTIAPIDGTVNDVVYESPFINQLPEAWKEALQSGELAEFRNEINTMVEQVNAMFPYASIIHFNNEYQANWERFGNQLGDFASHGITNTTESAQSSGHKTAKGYLYFDEIHPTRQGHSMLAKAIELTLMAEQKSIRSARLTAEIQVDVEDSTLIGSPANEHMIGLATDDTLIGRGGHDLINGAGGKDRLNGNRGKDLLIGGLGADRMRGGLGADLFAFELGDADSSRDQILDFKPEQQGDRLGLSNAFAEAKGDLFFMPTSSDWDTALEIQSHGKSSTLLKLDLNNNGKSDFEILLKGIAADSFDTAWIS